MKLRRFLLRYYPPGIVLEYQRRNGDIETKSIDLLTLKPECDVDALVDRIILEEPLLSDSKKLGKHSLVRAPHPAGLSAARKAFLLQGVVRRMIYKLMDKLENQNKTRKFYLYKILRAHILPLTNCAFNKSGSKFITGSYDRTCRVWDTITGDELVSLEGHRNVVYALAFNNPFGDKILTGSFDKTARIWDTQTGGICYINHLVQWPPQLGCISSVYSFIIDHFINHWPDSGQCLHVLVGHTTEIVCVAFCPRGAVAATGSMDRTAKLWCVDTGAIMATLEGHTAEIVSLAFNTEGTRMLTGSFDNTARLWDVSTGTCLHVLASHSGEIAAAQFDFTGDLIVTGSIDRTCKVWDGNTGQLLDTLKGHQDEVLDVVFNSTGSRIATASADGTAKVYDIERGRCVATLVGHESEISKVQFSPTGCQVLTAASDHTCRIWDSITGQCLQVLEGHTDEVFSCAYNYEGDIIITGSKDNTCRIWKDNYFNDPTGAVTEIEGAPLRHVEDPEASV